MSDQKYVCVDLDGTILLYDEWRGENQFGKPVAGVQEALERLRSAGWKIIIYTTRSDNEAVSNYLKLHAIPFDYFNENPEQPKNATGGKPMADAYIDDRGIQFNGDWQKTATEVLLFVPWEKRKKSDQADEYDKEAISFLGRDYGEAFSQLRAYDAQIWEILKYSFGQLIASIAAVWVIFTLANGENPPAILSNIWKLVSAIILMISFAFGVLAIQLILQNRVYFTDVARYINDQREFFLSSKPAGFSNRSEYYTDWHKPKPFDFNSTQFLSVIVIALISSILLGFSGGLIGFYIGLQDVFSILIGAAVVVVSLTITIFCSIHYLKAKKEDAKS